MYCTCQAIFSLTMDLFSQSSQSYGNDWQASLWVNKTKAPWDRARLVGHLHTISCFMRTVYTLAHEDKHFLWQAVLHKVSCLKHLCYNYCRQHISWHIFLVIYLPDQILDKFFSQVKPSMPSFLFQGTLFKVFPSAL